MLIAFDAADAALSSKYSSLWAVASGGWTDYNSLVPAEVRAVASTRSRASLVHDFMVNRARKLAEIDQDICCIQHRLMFTLAIKASSGLIAVRLKKMDEFGLSRNNPTKQVEDFRNQKELAGIEAKHHLEIGYVLTPLQDAVRSIELVCPSGDGIYWMAEVTPHSAQENNYNLWEHRGEEEQKNTGFTVKRRTLGNGNENESSNTG